MTNAPFDRSTSGDALAVAAILFGTPGDDELEAVGDGDILRGYAGRDLLTSAFNATELYGDADDDVLVTDVTVSGGEEGAAEVSALQDGGSGDDRLTVDARALARFGPAEIDLTLRGGLGDDVIQAFASIASFTDAVIVGDIDGGQGDDTIGVQMEVEAETNAMPLRTRGGVGSGLVVYAAHPACEARGVQWSREQITLHQGALALGKEGALCSSLHALGHHLHAEVMGQ